eukprot:gene4335-5426_t
MTSLDRLPIIIIKVIINFVKDDFDKISVFKTCKSLYRNRDLIPSPCYLQIHSESFSTLPNNILESSNKNRKLYFEKRVIASLFDTIPHNLNAVSNLVKLSILLKNNEIFQYIRNSKSLNELKITIFNAEGSIRIDPGFIPDSVEFLSISMSEVIHIDIVEYPFSNLLVPGSLPSKSLERLEIDYRFIKHDVQALIPLSIIDLLLDYWSYIPGVTSDQVIPRSVKILRINGRKGNFHFPVGFIPDGIERLELGNCDITQSSFLPGVFPNSLKELNLGNYSGPLTHGVFPEGLKTLNLGYGLNTVLLPGVIPQGVTSLSFGNSFVQSLDSKVLPPNLIEGNFWFYSPLGLRDIIFPHSMTRMSIGINELTPQKQLPPNLEHLECLFRKFTVGLLPSKLKSLTIQSNNVYEIQIGSLPESLEIIRFQRAVYVSLEGVLPKSLKQLYFCRGVTCTITPLTIPDSTEHLYIHKNNWESYTTDYFPSNLKTLEIAGTTTPTQYVQIINLIDSFIGLSSMHCNSK